jgi:hypothetical protein
MFPSSFFKEGDKGATEAVEGAINLAGLQLGKGKEKEL